MNSKAARAFRKHARAVCDASLTTMMVKSYKVPAVLARDENREVITRNGEPAVLIPEHKRYTAFWPPQSFRRIIREIKDGKRAGAPVPR